MIHQEYTTSHGLRILHCKDSSSVIYAGYGISIGSYNDPLRYYGMAHMVEHMLFKGTTLRSATQLIRRVEDIGSEINAFTGKNETMVHATFPARYAQRVVQVLTDILLNSTIPEEELVKEKDVIIEEICSYEDSPSEMIFDDFESLHYKGTPLAHNILGSQNSVTRITQRAIREFIHKNYIPQNMVFCIQGDVDLLPIINVIEREFDKKAPFPTLRPSQGPTHHPIKPRPTFSKNISHYDTIQAHCILGFDAPSIFSSDRRAMALFNNILAGPAMSSELNLLLRETHGLVYNVEGSYSAFPNSGMECIYWGCAKKNIDRSVEMVHNILDSMCKIPLSKERVHRATLQLKGQMILAEDNREVHFLSMTKRYLYFSNYVELEQTLQSIDKITESDLLHIAQEYARPEKRNLLIYK